MSEQASNSVELSVSELSRALKRAVESQFGYVRVRGEISRFTRAASGHCYWRLKDDSAVLDAVMWKGQAAHLNFKPEEGVEVICTGKLSTYPGRSNYQIIVESMEIAGEGALMAMLEARKKALAAEGLFDNERKKALPFLPRHIAVVTSPTGAVIRDILHRLSDRFPRRVTVWPVLVQGEGAEKQVVNAIQRFDAMQGDDRPDLLIVARGGGSLEDLMAFNEEAVVRAVASCSIPVISAVGHETDTTLCDYAADRRAPTPTAAAEMAVPVRRELLAETASLWSRLIRVTSRARAFRRDRLTGLARGLPRPANLLDLPRQRLDGAGDRLPRALMAGVQRQRHRLEVTSQPLRPQLLLRQPTEGRQMIARLSARMARATQPMMRQRRDRLTLAAKMLRALSYQGVLDRGFALVEGGDGAPVRSADALRLGDDVSLVFADGKRVAQITDAPVKKKPQKRPKKMPSKGGGTDQGSLF